MFRCHPFWKNKTINYIEFEDLLTKWYMETEESERMFIAQAEDVLQKDILIEENNERCRGLMQTCMELSAAQKVIDCEVNMICCYLCSLQDTVCCLEALTCYPDVVDCQRFYLYNMVAELFIKVHRLREQAEELESLMETQRIMYKVISVISTELRILDRVLVKTNEIEDKLLSLESSQNNICSQYGL